MSRHTSLSLGSLVLLAAVPFAWLACGGGKPPETPADESASSSESSGAAPSDSSAPAGSAAADMSSDNSGGGAAGGGGGGAAPSDSAASAPAAPAAPAAPPFGDSDCGKCVDKACAKPIAACGKNNDCQSFVDSVHSCSSDKGASACIGSGTMPSAAKPKKLAGAYATCATKASTSKACKATCK
jgi:hypothetical protein